MDLLTNKKYLEQVNEVFEQIKLRQKQPLYTVYSESSEYPLSAYPKHSEFISSTKTCGIVYFRAANRVGKSTITAKSAAHHLTGLYPSNWEGRVFDKPIKCWIVGVTHIDVRNVFQRMLLSEAVTKGDGGFIPKELVVRRTTKQGIPDAVLDLYVKHVPTYLRLKAELGRELTDEELLNNACSVVSFKCYEQRRDQFQGDRVDLVIFDEEPPADIYDECLLRTTGIGKNKSGLIMIAATPLHGKTPFVKKFDDTNPNRKCIVATWDDVPHLSEETKATMISEMEPHMIEARTKGIVYLGSGLVFPVSPSRYIQAEPLETIPLFYQLINGLDVGRVTFAVYGAINPVTKILHIYAEKEFVDVPVPVKAYALSQISYAPYVADTAINELNEFDLVAMNKSYIDCGLTLLRPNKKLKEAFIAKGYAMLVAGQIQIDKHQCPKLIEALMSFHRDEDGKISPKQYDHPVDALLYLLQGYVNGWGVKKSQIAYNTVEYMDYITEIEDDYIENNSKKNRWV